MQNLNFLYNENLNRHLFIKAYKENDSLFKIYLGMLHHGEKNTPFSNDNLRCEYTLYGPYGKSASVKEDSLRLIYNEPLNSILNFDLVFPGKGKYQLRLSIENEEKEKLTTLEYIRNNSYSKENYLLSDTAGQVLLYPNLGKDGIFKVQTQKHEVNLMHVNYYHRSFFPAAPPFIYTNTPVFKFKPDSSWNLSLNELIKVHEKGIYHLVSDTNQREGISIFRYDDGFPVINTARDMLLPLRYITSSEEYREIAEAGNIRLAVEEFWLKLKGNIERARHSIRRYYTRVEDANILFSSYLEGWKSDRGMIYIIYGPPTLVNRSDHSEFWYYGERNSPGVLRFEFIKIKNPYSDNDYQLVRLPNYKESWYINVDNWRR